MDSWDRRQWLIGAGVLALAPSGQAVAADGGLYDYLFVDLEGTPSKPAPSYVDHLRGRAGTLKAAGGEIVGLFSPQLGWVARQRALLVRWAPGARDRDRELTALMRGRAVRVAQRAQLTPTVRPQPADRPTPGGVYVHRWFAVEADKVEEFQALSVEGWRDFESRFDTRVFGLFTAERSASDRRERLQRFLLITRYRDHGVWEASRDPTTEAMAAFRRRQLITRDTWAASTVLTPL